MHRATVYSSHARSSEVCTEQPFFSAVLLASKKARINRLLTNAQSIEVCSKQPFTHSCSKLQSMYGAIVYSGMLEAPKFVRSNIFLCYALSIEVCTAADQPVYSVSNARSML